MALGKVIGLDASASWNPAIAVIPSYINNFDDGEDTTFIWISTESNGDMQPTIDNETYYKVRKINNKEVAVERTATTAGYDKASTTATITISVARDDEHGYAEMTRTITIGPSTYAGNISNIPEDISQCTPAQIQTVLNAGVADSYFTNGVGSSTSAIKLNGTVGAKTFTNDTNFCAYVLGFNHNNSAHTGVIETADASGNAKNSIHFSLSRRKTKASGDANVRGDIAFVDSKLYTTGSDAAFRMNLTNSNSGGWKMSYMRTVICPQFYSAIDASWRSYIKPVKKWTDNVGGATDTAANVTATEDYIFLMAEFEIFGARSYANSSEKNYQQRYAYYTNNAEASARIRGADSAVSNATAGSVALGAAVHWWERSPTKGSFWTDRANDYFYSVAFLQLHIEALEYAGLLVTDTCGFVPNFVMAAD